MISTAHSFGQEPADDADWKRYLYVLQSSTLEWLPSQPFLLKADYQLYDLEGHPTVKGTVEENWPAGKTRQIQIHSPSLAVEEPQSDELNTHSRENYLVRQALLSIVRPFPSVTQRNKFRLEVAQNIAKVPFDCFSIVPPGITNAANNYAYCTNANNRIVAITGPEFVLDRVDFRHFHGHEVPMTVILSYQGKNSLSLHVTELDELQPETPASITDTKTSSSAQARIPAEVMVGNLIQHKNPKYPFEAKVKKISGTVVLTALIAPEGNITGLDVIASPHSLLAKSAVDAVQKWKYRPYILNGKPTTVETTIFVNYNIGSN
jgi:TonB family protein